MYSAQTPVNLILLNLDIVQSYRNMSMDTHMRLIPNATPFNLIATERAKQLSQNPWLKNVDNTSLKLLAPYLQLFSIPKGKTLFCQGDNTVFMILIQEGRVDIRKEGHGGEAQTIAIVGAGQVIGEMSLIDGGTRSATAIASEPTRAFILTESNFNAIRKQEPGLWGALLVRFIKTITRRLRRSSGQFVDILAEHGAVDVEEFRSKYIDRVDPKFKHSDADYLWRQLNALNLQVAKLSEQVATRVNAIESAGEKNFEIPEPLFSALSTAASANEKSLQTFVLEILEQHKGH